MSRTSKTRTASRMALAGLVAGLMLAAYPGSAHAGFIDGVRSVFQLPGEVDKLKEQYQEVQQGYNSALEQLEETKRQAEEARLRAEEARLRAEEYRKLQDQLVAENAGLAEQNRKLAEMVTELRDSEEARSKRTSQIKSVVWTAVLLVGGYFAVSRIARIVMRARARG